MVRKCFVTFGGCYCCRDTRENNNRKCRFRGPFCFFENIVCQQKPDKYFGLTVFNHFWLYNLPFSRYARKYKPKVQLYRSLPGFRKKMRRQKSENYFSSNVFYYTSLRTYHFCDMRENRKRKCMFGGYFRFKKVSTQCEHPALSRYQSLKS